MTTGDTKKDMAQAAMLAERLSRVSEAMDARQRQTAEQQQRMVQAMPDVLRQSADQALGQLTAQAAQAVRQGLNEPIASVSQQAAEHHKNMRASTSAMTQTQNSLAATINKLLWLTTALFATLLLISAAGSYLIWHYKQIVAQYQIEADLLRAYNQADVRLCGDQLCARVDRSDKRYGEYLPVKPR
jgi:hypothetical protein